MRKPVLFFAIALMVSVLPAGSAFGAPTENQSCANCHLVDPNVVVSASFVHCFPGGVLYNSQVSNTYSGSEGWALFSGSTNVMNGAYGYASFIVAPSTTYTFQGVSDTTYGLGGSNWVSFTSPSCVTCTDADNDTFNADGASCGQLDCNDADATINPNAVEIVGDGVDQNCNGFDLTIAISQATWSRSKRRLTVAATSGYGAGANLTLNGYGAMTYSAATNTWSKVVSVSSMPATVTVSGAEGSVSSFSWLNPDTREVENVDVLFFSPRLLCSDLFDLPVDADLRLVS